MIFGYARISGNAQLIHDNALDEQIGKLIESGCEKIISEQYSFDEKELSKFLQLVKILGVGDTLIVTKLDRFTRNAEEALEMIKILIDKGIKFKVLNLGTFDNTPQGEIALNMFSAFVEFENMIMKDNQASKEFTKTKEGYREGRPPKFTDEMLEHALDLLTVNGGSYTYKKTEEETGISVRTLTRAQGKRRKNILIES